MSDQRRSRYCGAIPRRGAAKFLGLLLGIGVAMLRHAERMLATWLAKKMVAGTINSCQALDGSFF